MINFKTIKWKNLLSSGNYWTEVTFDKFQNTLVVGKNGAGKSTILDALCFCLYNKSFRDINKPALVNSINGKETHVEVLFTSDQHHFKVVRGIKPDIFEIHKDGKLIDQTASGDYQGYLEKFVLKLNYKSFTQIVILGSASFTPFMQLKASDRREVIEDLLDIQIFSRMNKLVKTRQGELFIDKNSNKLKIEGTLEKIGIQRRYIAEAQEDVALRIREVEHEQDTNSQESIRLSEVIIDHTLKIAELKATITDKPKVQETAKKISQMEAQIETILSKHKKTQKFYHTEKNCPTCLQVIDEAFTASQLAELGTKIEEREKGLAQLGIKYSDAQMRLAAIAEVESIIQDHELAVSSATSSMNALDRENKKLATKLASFSVHHQSTGREQVRLEEYLQELAALEEVKKTIISDIAYYDAAGVLLKDTGVKTKIIRQYLPIINALVNKYLANMDFFVNFNLDETFKETIKSRHRDEFTYNSFSEGQKQRIDMALMLTWRAVAKLKNSADANILILDEIFDSSLDDTGVGELMKILHSLDATNVFVISHRGDLLQDKFLNVIKFKLHQDFSRIVTE